MIRLELDLRLTYEVGAPGADFVFLLHAAQTRAQTVLHEQLALNQSVLPSLRTDEVSHNRLLRMRAAPGPLLLHYQVTVDIAHQQIDPGLLPEMPVAQLPDAVLVYLYPSRYCPSDLLAPLALAEFGQLLPGHARVAAIQRWVQQRVRFESNTSTAATSALDTLRDGRGVCRDFAHLMIALCRALCIPARFVTGTDYGADPVLGPPDFHAYVEVYLGHRWIIFDPSGTAIPMGFMRLAVGRDAADVAFATFFGPVQSQAPQLLVQSPVCPDGRWQAPHRTGMALSTDAGP